MDLGVLNLNKVQSGRISKIKSSSQKLRGRPYVGSTTAPDTTKLGRRGRGAPAYHWTPRRCRRLLRLYTMTPLKLDSIGRVLTQGSFAPK